MRRPLFDTGIPRRLLADDGQVTVFDTNNFTPQENAPLAFAVTLFCWTWQNYEPFPVAAQLPIPAVGVQTAGDPTIYALAQRFVVDVVAAQASEVSNVAKPVVLLDRYIIRGDQKLIAQNLNAACSVANGRHCYIYGYFEAMGQTVPSIDFRALQPAALVAPFNAPPAVVAIPGANTAGYVTAHKLLPNYIDLFNININAGAIDLVSPEAGNDVQAFIRFPGTVKMPVPVSSGHILLQSKPFDGQPLTLPNGATDVNIDVGFDDSGAAGNVGLVAYGSFTRR